MLREVEDHASKEKGKFEDMAKVDKTCHEREMKTYIPPKEKTKKLFKDPNASKRPPSGFFLFFSAYCAKIKGEHPGLSIDVAKKLGEMQNNTAATVYNSKDLEPTQMPIDDRLDRENMAHIHLGILCSHQKR